MYRGHIPTRIEIEIVEGLCFETLIRCADLLEVTHNYEQWLDDEWPDKEDELRVKVAEAMEKLGD